MPASRGHRGLPGSSRVLFHVQKRGWHRAPWPPSGAGTALECLPRSQAPFPCLELPLATSTQNFITAFLYLTLWWLCLPGAELQTSVLSSACARRCLKASEMDHWLCPGTQDGKIRHYHSEKKTVPLGEKKSTLHCILTFKWGCLLRLAQDPRIASWHWGSKANFNSENPESGRGSWKPTFVYCF